MPPYKESDLSPREILKFLRVDDQLIVGDRRSAHRDIAINDGLLDTLNRARYQDKSRVDAGFLEVSETRIEIFGDSLSLGVAIKPETRAKTAELFRQQTTFHDVTVTEK